LADVRIPIHIARPEYEAAAELERILSRLVLRKAAGFGALAVLRVVGSKQMQDVGGLETHGAVSPSLRIDQQWKCYSRFFPEQPGVLFVAQADGGQLCASRVELELMLAQLRDMLTAEDSSVMAQKDDHGGILFPQRAKPHLFAARIR
jgi:hypothetical protein